MARPLTHDGVAINALVENASACLPVFPLPNCVLLPGGLLPLHIFEPRYRALARACLDGDGVMGIARLMPSYGAHRWTEQGNGETMSDHAKGQQTQASAFTSQLYPNIFPTLGLGQIVCSEELEDGRFVLLLRGIARVTVRHELAMLDGYRRFQCERLHDEPRAPTAEVIAIHQRIISLCDQIAPHLANAGQQLCELARITCPGLAADAIAAAITVDANERQRILETASVEKRLQHTEGLLGEVLLRAENSQTFN
jgi:uncharacterized protein